MSKKVTAVAALVIIVLCMTGYLALVPKALDKLGILSAAEADSVSIVDASTTEVADTDTVETSSVSSVSPYTKLLELRTKVEDRLNNIGFRYQFIEMNGGLQRLADRRFIVDADPLNNVYKLSNGHLTTIAQQQDSLLEYAGNMKALYDFLDEKGIDLLYVQAPHKNSKFEDLLPPGVIDYTNANADEFLKLITQEGIDNIDLRQAIQDEGLDHYGMFFKTDHHWTPEAGLWASGEIAAYLNTHYGFDFDNALFDEGNYDVRAYPTPSLGSLGHRTGILYADCTDEVSVITPRFDSDLTVSTSSKGIVCRGNFSETIFDFSVDTGNIYTDNIYYLYPGNGALPPLLIIKNNSRVGKQHILIIKDSFAQVVAPFLALGVAQVDMIDLRTYDDSLFDYIEDSNPDLVLFLYNPSMLDCNEGHEIAWLDFGH
jgi:hypothetical protein